MGNLFAEICRGGLLLPLRGRDLVLEYGIAMMREIGANAGDKHTGRDAGTPSC